MSRSRMQAAAWWLWLPLLLGLGMPVPAQEAPPFVTRGMPGPGQAAMRALEGEWAVRMSLFAAMGTPDRPLVSDDLVARRAVIAGGRFLTEEVSGTVASQPYFRRGTLGFSNMDGRYEWVTQDALNAGMMIYLGAPNAGPGFPASLEGRFTDQGLLGEASAGAVIRQRTVITLRDADHHVIDILFTPPGGEERLVDRKEYRRLGGR